MVRIRTRFGYPEAVRRIGSTDMWDRRAPRFIGREAELSLLGRRLADVRGGPSRSQVFGGDAGVGKTR